MEKTIINTMGPGVIVKRIILTFADFSKAATTSTIDIEALVKGSFIIGVRPVLDVAFSGGTVSAATLAIGSKVLTDVDYYVDETSVFTGVAAGTALTFLNTQAGETAETITATLVTTTANADALTAGQVHVDLLLVLREDLTATAPTGNSLATGGQL